MGTPAQRVQVIGVLDENTTLAGGDIQINFATLRAALASS